MTVSNRDSRPCMCSASLQPQSTNEHLCMLPRPGTKQTSPVRFHAQANPRKCVSGPCVCFTLAEIGHMKVFDHDSRPCLFGIGSSAYRYQTSMHVAPSWHKNASFVRQRADTTSRKCPSSGVSCWRAFHEGVWSRFSNIHIRYCFRHM